MCNTRLVAALDAQLCRDCPFFTAGQMFMEDARGWVSCSRGDCDNIEWKATPVHKPPEVLLDTAQPETPFSPE